jgi:hypothetical protein
MKRMRLEKDRVDDSTLPDEGEITRTTASIAGLFALQLSYQLVTRFRNLVESVGVI